MSQPTEKSLSCLHIGVLLEVTVERRWIPCFSALSTLSLFDYVQNEISLSAQHLSDDCTECEHDQAGEDEDSVRSDLQELLRRAYAENGKRRR